MNFSRVSNGLENAIAYVAGWIHSRYRNECEIADNFYYRLLSAVPLAMEFEYRRLILDNNKIVRREMAKRDKKRK